MIRVMNDNSESEVVDDQMILFSQIYTGGGIVYAPTDQTSAQQAPPNWCSFRDKKVETRRRKKSKVNMLGLKFGNDQKLESEIKDRLAAELGLDPRQVAVWFQNRRARWKTKKLDEECSQLKAAHDSLVIRNCQLEFQVMKLEKRLAGVENGVKRLAGSSEGTTSSNRTMSCPSMEDMDAPFMGGFGMVEGLQNVF